jgi:drug/metabolite transporter (DMT)-like permease
MVSSSRANRRGIFALVGAMGTFSANDAIMKYTGQIYPLGEVIAVRGLITTVLVGALVIGLGHFSALHNMRHPLVLGRTALDGAAMLLFIIALVHMPLADLSAINLASPLIITALAVLIDREDVGWRRWCAIAVGFVGTVFIVKPTPSSFDAWALLGLACSFAGATRDLVTRRLAPGIPTIVISFMAALSSTIIGAVMGVWESWRMLAAADLGLLAIAAVLMGTGHFLIVIAFRDVDVAAIAPFRYTLLLFAGFWGYVVFGEVPDRFAVFGSILIVGSGLYALHREVVRRRTVAASVPPSEPGA